MTQAQPAVQPLRRFRLPAFPTTEDFEADVHGQLNDAVVAGNVSVLERPAINRKALPFTLRRPRGISLNGRLFGFAAGALLAPAFGLVLGTMAQSFVQLGAEFAPLLLGSFAIAFIAGIVMRTRWSMLVVPATVWTGALVGTQIVPIEMAPSTAEMSVLAMYFAFIGSPFWATLAGLGANTGRRFLR